MSNATMMQAISEDRQRLPWFELPQAAGGHLRSTSFRGKANLLVLMLPDAGDQRTQHALQVVDGLHARLDDVHSRSLAIVCGSLDVVAPLPSLLGVGIPIVADESCWVLRQLAGDGNVFGAEVDEPIVVLTDRYGEIRHRANGWGSLTPDAMDEWLDRLRYVDCLCAC